MTAYLAFALLSFRLGVRVLRGLWADAKHPKGADVLTKAVYIQASRITLSKFCLTRTSLQLI